MSMPGSDLSQPASSTEPSSRSANITVSTESAMTSRETSEARMPSWPMEMPSETEMVPNSSGKPPAACTPSLARLASRSRERLQGVISFHDEATPICGFSQSSSPMPDARSMARAGRPVMPSVTSRLRGFTSALVRGSTVVRAARVGAVGGAPRGYDTVPTPHTAGSRRVRLRPPRGRVLRPRRLRSTRARRRRRRRSVRRAAPGAAPPRSALLSGGVHTWYTC
jgi:hypothetical protein